MRVAKIALISLFVLLNGLTFTAIYFGQNLLLLGIGGQMVYHGENTIGNMINAHALAQMDSIPAEILRSFSVQNTKNGNYHIARKALDKAMKIDPKSISRYYGWLLLYYYHDYSKALEILELHDSFTPNFSDEPMGENIHYLKGLAHLQLNNFEKAINEFQLNITEVSETHGEEWVSVYTFVELGRAYNLQEKPDSAISNFKKAIFYYKDCTEAYYFLGLTYHKLDQTTKACNNIQKALELIRANKKHSDSYVELFHEVYEQDVLVAANSIGCKE